MYAVHLGARRPDLLGGAEALLSSSQVHDFVVSRLNAPEFTGARVCVLVPDSTRSCPLPQLMDAVHAALHGRAAELTFMVALGTHPAMSEKALAAWFGYRPGQSQDRYPGVRICNHEWWRPEVLAHVSTIPGTELAILSGGRITRPVDGTIACARS